MTENLTILRVKPSFSEIVNDEGKIITHEQYADDNEIIKAIREAYPDMIETTIYYFPNGDYHFITDKGYPFNIRKSVRPLTESEREYIKSMRYALRVKKDYIYTDEDKEVYNRDKKLYSRKIKEIYKKASDEGDYIIKPLKKGKQIRIFISGFYKEKFNDLGYKIIELERKIKDCYWNEEKLTYLPNESKKISYSFNMSFKAFDSACRYGEIPNKGFYIGEDGSQIKLTQSGLKETITINGITYSSKSEAAREMNISPSLISKKLKADRTIEALVKGTMNNRKGFNLTSPDGEIMEFESVRAAGIKLGIDKSKISRLIKGKGIGDIITIEGIDYIYS